MWNAEIIGALTGMATVLIWLLYLNMFWHEHRRRNRPFLVIHHATAQSPEATCLFVNMSKEPVHIQCVIAYLNNSKERTRHYLTNFNRINPQSQNSKPQLLEGPIMPGGYLILGTFEDIIIGRDVGLEKSQNREKGPSQEFFNAQRLREVETMEICVAVTHGQTINPIGARRTFFIEEYNSEIRIRSLSIHTEQLTNRKKRKIVRKWVESRLEPKLRGVEQTEQTTQNQEKQGKNQ